MNIFKDKSISEVKLELLESPEIRDWVKNVIRLRDEADPVDMIHDIQLLESYFRHKIDSLK